MATTLLANIQKGDVKTIARSISFIENEIPGYDALLKSLPLSNTPVIGITGAPGAGKSTMVDALIQEMVQQQKRVAVVCVDPSSPFNLGAVLGDRIRMSNWYTHPNVYIRSLATRGALGGLHPKIIEITDLLKAAPFDFIIVETVGVGQSEVEIAGLADTTVVVLVPEAGDEVQTMKAGLMEIADIFVVNKADRPGADLFLNHLRSRLAPSFSSAQQEIPLVKTVATQHTGISELLQKILAHSLHQTNERKRWLLAEKAFHLIQQKRMKGLNKAVLLEDLKNNPAINLYSFIEKY